MHRRQQPCLRYMYITQRCPVLWLHQLPCVVAGLAVSVPEAPGMCTCYLSACTMLPTQCRQRHTPCQLLLTHGAAGHQPCAAARTSGTTHPHALCLCSPQAHPRCAVTITEEQLHPGGCGGTDPEVGGWPAGCDRGGTRCSAAGPLACRRWHVLQPRQPSDPPPELHAPELEPALLIAAAAI